LTICGLVNAFLSERPRPASSIRAGRNATVADREPPRKILLCAPSNAAIDELANRVRGIRMDKSTLKVVRVGSERVIGNTVKDIFLDNLVDQKLNSEQSHNVASKDTDSGMDVLRAELESLKRQKQIKQAELSQVLANSAGTSALQDEIKRLNAKRIRLSQRFDQMKDKLKSDLRTVDATRRRLRDEILREADVICSTLSGAGHDILEQFDFEMIVIDEAAQGE
jgi:senataxin